MKINISKNLGKIELKRIEALKIIFWGSLFFLLLLFLFIILSSFNAFGVIKDSYMTLQIPLQGLNLRYFIFYFLKSIFPALLIAGVALYFLYILRNFNINVNSNKTISLYRIFSVFFIIGVVSLLISEIVTLSYPIYSAKFDYQPNISMLTATLPVTISLSKLVKYFISFFMLFLIINIIYMPTITTLKAQSKKQSKLHVALFSLTFVLLFAAIFFVFASSWVLNTFGTVTAEKFMFQIMVPLKGTGNSLITSFLLRVLLPVITLFFVLLNLFVAFKRRIFSFDFYNGQRTITLDYSYGLKSQIATYVIVAVAFAASIYSFSAKLDMFSYIKNVTTNSDFIANNYVDPKTTKITFPEKKRNLIYIYMESMEDTFLSIEKGGGLPFNIISELEELANENTAFSGPRGLTGATSLPYTGWTIAAMVAQSSGLPLKTPVGGNDNSEFSSFLPKVTAIGDILEKQNYNQTLLVGSDAIYGGRKDFYVQHGNYKILDYFTAPKDGIIDEGYKVFWGFEDQRLYKYAKKELKELAAKKQPFNLTMLTGDTHHVGGYKCELCKDEYDQQYFNVISCASRQVTDFVKWIQSQDFYNNTTIIISGDHTSMDNLIPVTAGKNYDRTIYNVFINSAVEAGTKSNRVFSSLDMFPSTLASMGVVIGGDKLALGTNLFSETPTLLEEYGTSTVISELNKKSIFYNSLTY